jgi:hypothetical protein
LCALVRDRGLIKNAAQREAHAAELAKELAKSSGLGAELRRAQEALAVSRAFPSWNRSSTLTEIYLYATPVLVTKLRMETPGQAAEEAHGALEGRRTHEMAETVSLHTEELQGAQRAAATATAALAQSEQRVSRSVGESQPLSIMVSLISQRCGGARWRSCRASSPCVHAPAPPTPF